jgi:hypothetical protein
VKGEKAGRDGPASRVARDALYENFRSLMALEVHDAAAGALGRIELDVRLGGEGIAQHADALAIDDL